MNEFTSYSSSVHETYSQNMSKSLSSQNKLNDTSPTNYDLQDIIQQYQSKPELLKLILTSKVEEDKRKAEEAKLRAKELDLYLQQGNQPPSPEASPRRLSVNSIIEEHTIPSAKESRKISVVINSPTHSSNRTSPYPIPRYNTSIKHQKHNSFSSESSLDSLDDPHQQRRHSAAAAMLAMGGSFSPSEMADSKMDDDCCLSPTERATQIDSNISSSYPSPVTDHCDLKEKYDSEVDPMLRPRRRREMQAITKIVETREFPYVDSYFWKNNGNTVQKKTGCKSIYYKCSNSNKGCSVNKTVTARSNGEYLIKYRGSHLPECGRVERIRDL
ncbi:hypothetical protein K501DRAFT_288167 [Backusella circina FSU 941]|nr:hypothetical protein K501DRAFT_288167 [Backusella circina FSU 941]